MKVATLLRLATLSTVAFAAGIQAKEPTRSAGSLPQLPAATANASPKSQGLPNADGEKPGTGNGYGHYISNGKGHENGKGHGHDSDSPG
jgi:hypothetical protein